MYWCVFSIEYCWPIAPANALGMWLSMGIQRWRDFLVIIILLFLILFRDNSPPFIYIQWVYCWWIISWITFTTGRPLKKKRIWSCTCSWNTNTMYDELFTLRGLQHKCLGLVAPDFIQEVSYMRQVCDWPESYTPYIMDQWKRGGETRQTRVPCAVSGCGTFMQMRYCTITLQF